MPAKSRSHPAEQQASPGAATAEDSRPPDDTSSLYQDLVKQKRQALQVAKETLLASEVSQFELIRSRRLRYSLVLLAADVLIIVMRFVVTNFVPWPTEVKVAVSACEVVLIGAMALSTWICPYEYRMVPNEVTTFTYVFAAVLVPALVLPEGNEPGTLVLFVMALLVYAFPKAFSIPDQHNTFVFAIIITILVISTGIQLTRASNAASMAINAALIVAFALAFYLPQRTAIIQRKRQVMQLASMEMESHTQLLLLLRVIPRVFLPELMHNERIVSTAKRVAVLFCEVMAPDPSQGKGLHKLGNNIHAETLQTLSRVFKLLDGVVKRNGVYKVETIGSEYMAVSGLPVKCLHPRNPVFALLRASIAMLDTVHRDPTCRAKGITLQIGINAGTCVEAILGRRLLPRWKLFGNTVNTAARMKSSGTPRHIHVSTDARELLMHDVRGFCAVAEPDLVAHATSDLAESDVHVSAGRDRRNTHESQASEARGAAGTSKGSSTVRDGTTAKGRFLDSEVAFSSPDPRMSNLLGMWGEWPSAVETVDLKGAVPSPEQLVPGQKAVDRLGTTSVRPTWADVLLARLTGLVLVPRPAIWCKGKGVMQTFVVDQTAGLTNHSRLDVAWHGKDVRRLRSRIKRYLLAEGKQRAVKSVAMKSPGHERRRGSQSGGMRPHERGSRSGSAGRGGGLLPQRGAVTNIGQHRMLRQVSLVAQVEEKSRGADLVSKRRFSDPPKRPSTRPSAILPETPQLMLQSSLRQESKDPDEARPAVVRVRDSSDDLVAPSTRDASRHRTFDRGVAPKRGSMFVTSVLANAVEFDADSSGTPEGSVHQTADGSSEGSGMPTWKAHHRTSHSSEGSSEGSRGGSSEALPKLGSSTSSSYRDASHTALLISSGHEYHTRSGGLARNMSSHSMSAKPAGASIVSAETMEDCLLASAAPGTLVVSAASARRLKATASLSTLTAGRAHLRGAESSFASTEAHTQSGQDVEGMSTMSGLATSAVRRVDESALTLLSSADMDASETMMAGNEAVTEAPGEASAAHAASSFVHAHEPPPGSDDHLPAGGAVAGARSSASPVPEDQGVVSPAVLLPPLDQVRPRADPDDDRSKVQEAEEAAAAPTQQQPSRPPLADDASDVTMMATSQHKSIRLKSQPLPHPTLTRANLDFAEDSDVLEPLFRASCAAQTSKVYAWGAGIIALVALSTAVLAWSSDIVITVIDASLGILALLSIPVGAGRTPGLVRRSLDWLGCPCRPKDALRLAAEFSESAQLAGSGSMGNDLVRAVLSGDFHAAEDDAPTTPSGGMDDANGSNRHLSQRTDHWLGGSLRAQRVASSRTTTSAPPHHVPTGCQPYARMPGTIAQGVLQFEMQQFLSAAIAVVSMSTQAAKLVRPWNPSLRAESLTLAAGGDTSASGSVANTGRDVLFQFSAIQVLSLLVASSLLGLRAAHMVWLAITTAIIGATALALSGVDNWLYAAVWLGFTVTVAMLLTRENERQKRRDFFTHFVAREGQRITERMLHAMLPKAIADAMIDKGMTYRALTRMVESISSKSSLQCRSILDWAGCRRTPGSQPPTPMGTPTNSSHTEWDTRNSQADAPAARRTAGYGGAIGGPGGSVVTTDLRHGRGEEDAVAPVAAARKQGSPGSRDVQKQGSPGLSHGDRQEHPGKQALPRQRPQPRQWGGRNSFSVLTGGPQMKHTASLAEPTTNQVALLMFDLVGFTQLSAEIGPHNLVTMLDDLYGTFDKLVERRGAYKVETIGDAFLVCCGAPTPRPAADSAVRIAKCALDMMQRVSTFQAPGMRTLEARIGIHIGKVLTGVIGTQMPRYQLFGPQVDYAMEMESSSFPGRVHASADILHYLADAADITVDSSLADGSGFIARNRAARLYTPW